MLSRSPRSDSPATTADRPAPAPAIRHVTRDADLTTCRRQRAARGLDHPWRPFRVPAEARVWVVPPPANGMPLARHPASRSRPDGHGLGQRLLIVDDREPYRRLTLAWYNARQHFRCEVVATASEGLALLTHRPPGYYDMIVSDVSMEYELAGVFLARAWRRFGFEGVGVLSSTGFDNWFGMALARWALGGTPNVDWLIPKASLKLGTPRFERCRGAW